MNTGQRLITFGSIAYINLLSCFAIFLAFLDLSWPFIFVPFVGAFFICVFFQWYCSRVSRNNEVPIKMQRMRVTLWGMLVFGLTISIFFHSGYFADAEHTQKQQPDTPEKVVVDQFLAIYDNMKEEGRLDVLEKKLVSEGGRLDPVLLALTIRRKDPEFQKFFVRIYAANADPAWLPTEEAYPLTKEDILRIFDGVFILDESGARREEMKARLKQKREDLVALYWKALTGNLETAGKNSGHEALREELVSTGKSGLPIIMAELKATRDPEFERFLVECISEISGHTFPDLQFPLSSDMKNRIDRKISDRE